MVLYQNKMSMESETQKHSTNQQQPEHFAPRVRQRRPNLHHSADIPFDKGTDQREDGLVQATDLLPEGRHLELQLAANTALQRQGVRFDKRQCICQRGTPLPAGAQYPVKGQPTLQRLDNCWYIYLLQNTKPFN